MPADQLVAEMKAEHRNWRISTRVYGALYPTVRILLITCAALAAASNMPGVQHWAPTLSVLVAVGTALDTWIKPRGK